jgi:O-antigen/teichoic acid export membrane protein
MAQLGIYGASVKLAVLMTLFIQMFRYAAEPFFFSKQDEKNAREIYSNVMTYFIFLGMVIFLGVMLFLDLFILFIGPEFREGASVIPQVLMANLLMGIFYNLSIWYKLSNKTIWGVYLVLIGAGLTFIVNYLFIPKYGYTASAWARFFSYLIMVIVSFLVGQKFYPVKYNLKKILFIVLLPVLLYAVFRSVNIENLLIKYLVKFSLFASYIVIFIISQKYNSKIYYGSKNRQPIK